MTEIAKREFFGGIPPTVLAFAKRAAILIGCWIILYHIILKPYRIPDRWLSNTTAAATAKLLDLTYAPTISLEKDGWACVVMGRRIVIRIADFCNGLELIALYLGFIICLPAAPKKMAVYALAGTACIFCLNVLRCAALAVMALKNHAWIDFAHKYVFTAIVYCFIFLGWMLYTRKHTAN